MKTNYIKTYNFFLRLGDNEFLLDVNAYSQDEAITIVKREFPLYTYILL